MNKVKELVEELRNKKSRDNRELLDRSADMIERLAIDLCEKSGCHHKCNDTKDCIVEDEAQLLILEKHLLSTLTNEEKVSEKGRYINADVLLKKLPDDLPYKASVKRVLIQAPTADVVPKSEVKALKNQVNRLQKYAAKRDEKLNALLVAKTKQEVAREIFEEIYETMNSVYASVQRSCVGMHGDNPETMRLLGKLEGVKRLGDEIAELKNKYTESESVLGEYKFDEKIHTGPLDLSDAKFIDEDGNVTTPADWQDWDNKTPPSVIEGVTCTIDFPDGREIKNPSAEEVLEWANGTQIPVYIVEESEDKE